MTKPLRAQSHYRYAKNARDAVIQNILDPKEQSQVLIRGIQELQEALHLTPYDGEMWACLGDLLFFTGQEQSALDSYKTALRYFRAPSLYINLGAIYVKLNMYDEAEQALRSALAFCPGQKDALHALEVIQKLRKG